MVTSRHLPSERSQSDFQCFTQASAESAVPVNGADTVNASPPEASPSKVSPSEPESPPSQAFGPIKTILSNADATGDAFLQDIRDEIKIEDFLAQHKNARTHDVKAKAWANVATNARTYGDDMVNRWNREIETYLIFAGLFSAVLTAFNVQMLQPPAQDSIAQAVKSLSLQLHSFSIAYPFINSTHSGGLVVRDAEVGVRSAHQSTTSIWVNSLWFPALILSLASALVGIVVKQWLSEYSAISGSSHDKARQRHFRAINLERWYVGEIVMFIPILLVILLGFFFAGLIVLLWTLHHSVAIFSSVLVAAVSLFMVGVAMLPVISVSCAYLSPQSRVIYSLWQSLRTRIATPSRTDLPGLPDNFRSNNNILSDTFDEALLDRVVAKPSPLSWDARAQKAIDDIGVTLDMNILVTAYESTLNPEAVSSAAICVSDLQPDEVLKYFLQLHDSIVNHSDKASHPATGCYPTTALLVFHVLLCVIQLSYARIEDSTCRDALLKVSSPGHHIWRDTASEHGE